jgi:hypothetical protein
MNTLILALAALISQSTALPGKEDVGARSTAAYDFVSTHPIKDF